MCATCTVLCLFLVLLLGKARTRSPNKIGWSESLAGPRFLLGAGEV